MKLTMTDKHRVCVVTSTRADYGLLSPLIKALMRKEKIQVEVVATGMHLEEAYGNTYREIEEDGIAFHKIPIQEKETSENAVSVTMANAITRFSEFFSKNPYELMIVLGDRYEILAVSIAAVNAHIPIAHLYGGDTTEGAMDEYYRHAITKMSYLHFTSTKVAHDRVVQMGESPSRVFKVGSLGVDNALKVPLLSKNELAAELDFPLGEKYGVVTFHPVTMEHDAIEEQMQQLLAALDQFPDMQFIISKGNSDVGGNVINRAWEEYAAKHENVYLTASLGMKKYFSALKYATMCIGNSSSGLVEVPSFGIPTVNIGNRQKGREQGNTVFNCEPKAEEIARTMRIAMMPENREKCALCENPYGDGNAVGRIVNQIADYLYNDKLMLQKEFYLFSGQNIL